MESKETQAARLDDHAERISILEKVSKANTEGFPKEDPRAHREFHEEVMTAKEKRQKLYEDVRKTLITSGLWLTLLWLGGMLLEFSKFKMGIK